MAFPSNPSTGDTYTDDFGTLWTYNGFNWSRTTVSETNDTSYAGPGASIPSLGTFDGSGVTSVKGGLSFSRGDISYT